MASPRRLVDSQEASREPLAADDRQPDDGVVTRIRGADAAEVGDPAEAGVAADQRQEPLLLPHLVAVEVRPLLPRPPSAARSDAHVDVGRATDDSEAAGGEAHGFHDVAAAPEQSQLDLVPRDRAPALEPQRTQETGRGVVAFGVGLEQHELALAQHWEVPDAG